MIWFAIIAAIANAVQSFSSAEAQRKRMKYQADVESSNAAAEREEAKATRKEAEVAQRRADKEEQRLKRQYNQQTGENRSLLAAGNVDITSGSALNLLEGNANRFADDMGEMEFEEAMEQWSYEDAASRSEWKADVHESNASYLDSAAGSTAGSLLTAGLSGASSFASSYMMTQGFSAGGSLAGGGNGGGLAGSMANNSKWKTLASRYKIN